MGTPWPDTLTLLALHKVSVDPIATINPPAIQSVELPTRQAHSPTYTF